MGYEDARMIENSSQPGGPSKEGPADIVLHLPSYLIAPRIPPGRVDGLWIGWQFDCLNVVLDGCRDAFQGS